MRLKSFGTQHRGQKQTMGLVFIILILLSNDAHSTFVVVQSTNLFLWEQSAHYCKLTVAVPTVNLSTMIVKEKIALTGEAWVGYFQSYENFRVLACVPLSAIESYAPTLFRIPSYDNRPGRCFSLCGLQGNFGLQNDSCFCITTRNFSIPDMQSINSSCKNPIPCTNRMLCGHEGNNKIVLYMKVSIPAKDYIGDGTGCIIVTNTIKRQISVQSCSSRYHHLCEASTGIIQYLNVSQKEDEWMHLVKHCTENGKRPTSYIGDGTQFVFPNISGSWWISVVRDLVIRKRSEAGKLNKAPIYEGYLRHNTEGIKLEFVPALSASRKNSVVCLSDKMEIATSYQKTTPSMMTSSDPPKTMETRHTTDKMEIATSYQKTRPSKMTSSDPPKTMKTSHTTNKMGIVTSYQKTRPSTMTSTDPPKTMVISHTTDKMEIVTSYQKTTPCMMTTSDPPKTMKTSHTTGQTRKDQCNQTNKQATTALTSSTSETSATTQIPGQPGSKLENGIHTSGMTTTTSSRSKASTTTLITVLTTILPVGLIAAFTALIILYVKRRTVKVTDNAEASHQPTTESVVLSNAESRHKYYEHENDQGGNVCPEYDTLKEIDVSASSGTWNIYDRANLNICDGTYDVTFSANNPRLTVQANLYDHLRPKKPNDGNYDIADLQDKRNKMNGIETYEQTNDIASENGNYDTFKPKFKLPQHCEQNPYDTANFHTTK